MGKLARPFAVGETDNKNQSSQQFLVVKVQKETGVLEVYTGIRVRHTNTLSLHRQYTGLHVYWIFFVQLSGRGHSHVEFLSSSWTGKPAFLLHIDQAGRKMGMSRYSRQDGWAHGHNKFIHNT